MGCSGCGQMSKAEKVKSIVTGWRNVIWKDKKTEEEAIRRIEICADCGSNHRGWDPHSFLCSSLRRHSVRRGVPDFGAFLAGSKGWRNLGTGLGLRIS